MHVVQLVELKVGIVDGDLRHADGLERVQIRHALRQLDSRARAELILVSIRGIEIVVEYPAHRVVGGDSPHAVARERVVRTHAGRGVHDTHIAVPQAFERCHIRGLLHLSLCDPCVADVDDQRQHGKDRKDDEDDLRQHVTAWGRR